MPILNVGKSLLTLIAVGNVLIVTAQKISPEGKAKVQLQVVLHNGVSSTFHFSNKNGLQAQLADRDKVKELLQTLLPKFKRKVSNKAIVVTLQECV